MSIETIIAKYGFAALFLGAGLEGETVVVAGGLLAHKGLLPLPGAMAAAAAGSFVADQIFFSAGRYFRGQAWVKKVQQKPLFAKALGLLERHPIGFIFAFRFIYGFRTISPIAIGTTQVRTKLFVVINAVAAVVWGIVFTGIGYLFGHSFEKLLDRFLPHGHRVWVAAAVVAVIAAGLGAWHVWRARRETAE